jgi:hypothetical protein
VDCAKSFSSLFFGRASHATTDTLVDIAFGKCPAIGHIGLYGDAAVSKNFKESLEFSFASWSQSNTRDSDQTCIAGALCEYRGLRFILNLTQTARPPLNGSDGNQAGVRLNSCIRLGRWHRRV